MARRLGLPSFPMLSTPLCLPFFLPCHLPCHHCAEFGMCSAAGQLGHATADVLLGCMEVAMEDLVQQLTGEHMLSIPCTCCYHLHGGGNGGAWCSSWLVRRLGGVLAPN